MKLRARRINNFNLYANHAWYVPGVKGMFILLGLFLLGNLLGILVMGIIAAVLPPEAALSYGLLITYPLSFIPPMIYAAHTSQRNCLFETGYKVNSSHFGPYSALVMVLITILLTLGMMVSMDLPNYWHVQLTQSVPFLKSLYDSLMAVLNSMVGGPFWSSFLLTAIFAPVFEEWLCRGMVLRGLLTRMKPGSAIVVSALFFALIHMNPWQALNAFVIGLVMGVVYYRTGSLLLTMLIHFINNGTAVVLAQIPSLSEDEFLVDMIDRPTYMVVYVLGLAALAGGLYLVTRIPLAQERGNIDEIPVMEESLAKED